MATALYTYIQHRLTEGKFEKKIKNEIIGTKKNIYVKNTTKKKKKIAITMCWTKNLTL